ncbi:gamma-glutamyl hydrolase [Pundamilia nyererei]|uniref:folate gamma-glutamyl hydrolase n=1 Tax=Pundamilia nyererei TaxID=303518 RepID=A0A9Y6JH15_9CICH|nr:PREDICTED: gamma-glutamyl hydrolase-like [Pundamilia nyererei]
MFNTGVSTYLCLFFACCLCCSRALPTKLNNEAVNDRSVIGVLTQVVTDEIMKPFGRTYIPSSYVKYIESGGSRVMPIRLTLTTSEYEKIFMKINGLIFIGGDADLETSDFARVAKIFYRLALADGVQNMGDGVLRGSDESLEVQSSRMFNTFPDELINALTQEPLTGNFHNYGITIKDFQENEMLQSFFTILSTNIAKNGAHFVSTFEGKRYPFYGVQWHPEVNRFQWYRKLNFPHSRHAVQLSSLLAEFFVNEARRSFHHFDSPAEEESSLIYSYSPVYVANITAYEQAYFF